MRPLPPRLPLGQLAWLAWLLMPSQVAIGQAPNSTPDARHASADGAAPPLDQVAARILAVAPGKSLSAPALAKPKKSGGKRQRKQRPTSAPRVNGLTVTHGKVAAVDLRGVAPITPAGKTTAAVEHKIRLQNQARPIVSPPPVAQPVASSAGVLDESIVKEITQRKTMFRMCYASARRRGVTATRADVKWTLAANGTVRDVMVAVAQDAQLANCIRVIASRPYASGGQQDIPVAIPLLFVTSR